MLKIKFTHAMKFRAAILVCLITFACPGSPAWAITREDKLIRQIKEGDVKAMYDLARLYESGGGTRPSWRKALMWYERAAKQGYMPAIMELAWRYYTGKGVRKKDVRTAILWYERAAEKGVLQAQINLGVIYDEGRVVPEDDALAVEWYKKAAAQGSEIATFNLAYNYWKGEGTDKNYAEAWTLLNRLRTGSEHADVQARAAELMDRIKEELGITTSNYPPWEFVEPAITIDPEIKP